MTRTLFIRADGDARIGSGHLVRCSAIGQAMKAKGWRTVLGGMGESLERAALRPGFDEWVTLPSVAAPPPAHLAFHAALVDHYALDAHYEAALRRHCPLIAVLDDLRNRRHAADLLIDPTPGALTQPGVRSLTGANVAPLRPAFAQARQGALSARLLRKGGRRVFVSFGAFDPGGAALSALAVLMDARFDVDVDIAVHDGAPSAARLQALENERVHVFFDPDADAMVDLMRRADVAVGAPGSTTWERCCLGLPSVVTVVADNQRLIADTLHRSQAAIVAEDPSEAARRALHLLEDHDRRREISDRAAGLCDGRGAERIAEAIEDLIQAD